MCSSISQRFYLICAASEYSVTAHNDGPDRHFVLASGSLGLLKSELHYHGITLLW